ncbi:MAG: preprotein translocase subunit SecG [Clostridia bacterium]|nr:preprotein translocase subunit SecG [Clostridia bacterium]
MTGLLNVLFVVFAILLMAAVLLQSGRSAGVSGAIGGGAEQIFGRRSGLDEFLAKVTVVLAVAFFGVAIVLMILER